MSYSFADSLRQDQDGTGLVLLKQKLTSCQETCVTYTVAVYSEKLLMMKRGTVRNM